MGHVAVSWPNAERYLSLTLSADALLGVGLPILLLIASGRSPSDVGVALPNRAGVRLLAVALALSVPFGFLILPGGGHDPVSDLTAPLFTMSLLDRVPEHLFVCGVVTALLLPGHRLPGSPSPSDPALAWLGLTRPSTLALLGSGAVFFLIHLGKPNRLEIALSLPGGVAVAYMTLRARSIWPAVLAHWSMNVVPRVLIALMR
jgi:hypothetical protein